MIDYIIDLGDRLQQSNFTIHCATAYFDIVFLDMRRKNKISSRGFEDPNKSRLVALTCLFLASKYEELDDNIPSVLEFVDESWIADLEKRGVIELEAEIISEHLNWDLMILAPLHVAETLLSMGVIFMDDKLDNFVPPPILKKQSSVFESVRKCSLFFIDLSLELYSMKRYLPSIIALAAILCSWRINQVSPIWNDAFTELTSYPLETVWSCYE